MIEYSYKCNGCGHEFNEYHKMSDNKVPEYNPCPACGEVKVKQVLHMPKIISGVTGAGKKKLPSDFRNLMSKVTAQNPKGHYSFD